MREHEFSVVVNAPPHEVWEVFWYRAPDRPQSKLATIEILHPGDEVGEGLVRHCTFPVPKLLLSGGVGHSWEWLTQVRPYESWKYDAVGKPLWSKAEGWTRLEDLGDGRTRIHFRERYHAFNPVLRVLLERWVHRRISRDNDTILAGIEGGLRWMRRKNRQEAGNTLSPMANPIDEAVEGLTVPKIFLRRVASRPDEPAIRWKNPDGGDGWDEWTWREYADLVAKATGGLGRLGLRRGDRAVMMMRNVADFHVVDTALGFLGVCAISIYNSSSPEQVQYLTHHSEAKVAVVEDLSFLERFLKVRGELPQLERVVVLNDPDGLAPDDVLTRDDLFGGDAADLDELVDVARPEDLATIIYTSGTTGPPKGVMIDHHNVAWTGESLLRTIGQPTEGWRQISYLPMAHIAERMTGHYNHMRGGLVVYCCPEGSQIGAYMRDVRPNLLFGVPRVWEKVHAGVMAVVANEPDAERRKAMEDALDVGRKVAELTVAGEPVPADLAARHAEADAGVLALARALVGLDDCKVAITGAAPISTEVLWFFRAIGVPLSEIYGMSESTGPMTWDPYEVKIGTVGRAIVGCDVRRADDGEVIFRGGNAFKGYLKEPEKTAETLDDEGWVHSGDIGQFDDDGYLSIVDRKKELIITAGGKNISPANLESKLKSYPLIGQAAVIGDRRKFVSALIVLDPEVVPAWARGHNIEFASIADLAADAQVRAEVDREVEEVNKQVSQVEGIKRFTILPDEWLPDSEELTPTSKLKRRGILAKYDAEIEAMYA